jgi:hypothetical protein
VKKNKKARFISYTWKNVETNVIKYFVSVGGKMCRCTGKMSMNSWLNTPIPAMGNSGVLPVENHCSGFQALNFLRAPDAIPENTAALIVLLRDGFSHQ